MNTVLFYDCAKTWLGVSIPSPETEGQNQRGEELMRRTWSGTNTTQAMCLFLGFSIYISKVKETGEIIKFV